MITSSSEDAPEKEDSKYMEYDFGSDDTDPPLLLSVASRVPIWDQGGEPIEDINFAIRGLKKIEHKARFNSAPGLPSPEGLKADGLCPLMPEETVLMLAGLGFKRDTRIFLDGAQIYRGKSRLKALTSLFPNMVTKEDLLSSSEIKPFLNFSSQLAALDFITCIASDVFAMTDSGSQLSSLVSGYRVYYGGGKMPTIRPNKRRIADIFLKNNTIDWKTIDWDTEYTLVAKTCVEATSSAT